MLAQSNRNPELLDDGNNNVLNAESWDGTTLGTIWQFSCAVTASPSVIQDNRDPTGTGTVNVTMNYTGGTFLLSKNGPWGDSIHDWTGILHNTTRSITYQYVNYLLVTGVENINSSGIFDASGCELTFVIANGVFRGITGTLPADYPPLLDPHCGATRTSGTWADIIGPILKIDCVVPTQIMTWGGIKTLYRH